MLTPAPANPVVNSPRPSRLGRLAVPFRRARRWFVHQPRLIQVGLILVVVAAVVAGSVYTWRHLKNRSRAGEVAAGWQDYRAAVQKGDIDEVRAALGRVLAAQPGDDGATRYTAILDRGQADPDTPELALLFLNQHVQSDRLAEGAREAEIVLAYNPKHWMARCVLAHHAIQVQKDPARAEQTLAQLPDPEDPDAHLNPGGLLYALRLFDLIGRDADSLRKVIVHRLLPLLRTPMAANAPPAAKVQLLNCYLAPFSDLSALPELGEYWAVADKLADAAVNEAADAGDVTTLIRLAALGPAMRSALTTLHRHDPVRLPEDRFAPLAKALDERTRRAWQAVREKAPDRPEAYQGLAQLAVLENNVPEALQQLLDGLAACGERPELFDLLIPLVEQKGTADSVLNLAQRVWDSAEAAKTDPVKWCLASVAARAANRIDFALDACQRARKIDPRHPWACATEAQLWLRSGNDVRAREVLAALGETTLRVNPVFARLNARAMVGSGLDKLLDDELKAVVEAQTTLKTKTSAPAVWFILGVFDCEPTVERTEWVTAQIARILVDDPNAPAGRILQAEALYRLAELTVTQHPKADGSPPVWNETRVTVALRALEQLPLELRQDSGVIAMIAALQLKGQGMSAAALRTISPLLAREASLTPPQLEVLGAVLTANDRAGDAVRVLERAVRARPSAGGLTALALAYRKNNQPYDATRALDEAFKVAGASDREHAERVAAKILFQRENQ